jgi:hypothetical protein
MSRKGCCAGDVALTDPSESVTLENVFGRLQYNFLLKAGARLIALVIPATDILTRVSLN